MNSIFYRKGPGTPAPGRTTVTHSDSYAYGHTTLPTLTNSMLLWRTFDLNLLVLQKFTWETMFFFYYLSGYIHVRGSTNTTLCLTHSDTFSF